MMMFHYRAINAQRTRVSLRVAWNSQFCQMCCE